MEKRHTQARRSSTGHMALVEWNLRAVGELQPNNPRYDDPQPKCLDQRKRLIEQNTTQGSRAH